MSRLAGTPLVDRLLCRVGSIVGSGSSDSSSGNGSSVYLLIGMKSSSKSVRDVVS